MEIVPIINAASSLIIVLVFAFIAICAGIDKLQQNKLMAMKTIAKKAHVDFCENFGYSSSKPVSTNTVRQIIQSLAEGHEPHMDYLKSSDIVYNGDKTDGRP